MFIQNPLLVRICLVLRMPKPAPVPSSMEWSPDQHTIIHVIVITCDKNSNKKSLGDSGSDSKEFNWWENNTNHMFFSGLLGRSA